MSSLTERLVHKINNRLLSFEKQGLTDASQYGYLKEQISLLGASTKGGKVRVSETYDNVEQLERLAKTSTVRDIMTKTRQTMANDLGHKPTNDEVKEHIRQTGKLENWVRENLDSIYELSSELGDATELTNMLNFGLRNYDYAQIWARIDSFEKARNEWQKNGGVESEFMKFVERYREDPIIDNSKFDNRWGRS